MARLLALALLFSLSAAIGVSVELSRRLAATAGHARARSVLAKKALRRQQLELVEARRIERTLQDDEKRREQLLRDQTERIEGLQSSLTEQSGLLAQARSRLALERKSVPAAQSCAAPSGTVAPDPVKILKESLLTHQSAVVALEEQLTKLKEEETRIMRTASRDPAASSWGDGRDMRELNARIQALDNRGESSRTEEENQALEALKAKRQTLTREWSIKNGGTEGAFSRLPAGVEELQAMEKLVREQLESEKSALSQTQEDLRARKD